MSYGIGVPSLTVGLFADRRLEIRFELGGLRVGLRVRWGSMRAARFWAALDLGLDGGLALDMREGAAEGEGEGRRMKSPVMGVVGSDIVSPMNGPDGKEDGGVWILSS